jgi:putative transposase
VTETVPHDQENKYSCKSTIIWDKSGCYDNAAMESFWSTLKSDLIHRTTFQNLSDARLALFEYIEVFYNRLRLHSALGFKSPVDFEETLTYKTN